MLNNLTQHQHCTITTTNGELVTGVYVGVESQHGDWSVLVRRDKHTLSIPLDAIQAASAAAGA